MRYDTGNDLQTMRFFGVFILGFVLVLGLFAGVL